MIWFVGAGSGAADLITVRGLRLLGEADLVIYAGSLVNPELLLSAKAGAKCVDSAGMTLEEILDSMAAAERDGLLTVRLHSGDPSLYGAIREQMAGLDRLGIRHGTVPGVSSLFAAAAALRAEYTPPGVSQSLIVTRLAGRTPAPENLEELAAHGTSMAIFLSAGMLDRVQEALLKGAYRAETPAAIVYRASWPDELSLRCGVGDLAKTAREHGIDKTALVLVGDFLGDRHDRSRLYDPAFATGFRKAGDAD